MLTTTEEIQISETTTSYRINITEVNFEKTLDECYESARAQASENRQETLREEPNGQSATS